MGPITKFTFRTYSEEEALKFVKMDGYNIRFIDSPSEEVQLAAVATSLYAIRHIDEPTDKVLTYVIQKNSSLIEFIAKPSEFLCAMAVQINLENLKLIKSKEIVKSICKQLNIEYEEEPVVIPTDLV